MSIHDGRRRPVNNIQIFFGGWSQPGIKRIPDFPEVKYFLQPHPQILSAGLIERSLQSLRRLLTLKKIDDGLIYPDGIHLQRGAEINPLQAATSTQCYINLSRCKGMRQIQNQNITGQPLALVNGDHLRKSYMILIEPYHNLL